MKDNLILLLQGKRKAQERILLHALENDSELRLGESGWADSLVELKLMTKHGDTYKLTPAGYFTAETLKAGLGEELCSARLY